MCGSNDGTDRGIRNPEYSRFAALRKPKQDIYSHVFESSRDQTKIKRRAPFRRTALPRYTTYKRKVLRPELRRLRLPADHDRRNGRHDDDEGVHSPDNLCDRHEEPLRGRNLAREHGPGHDR